jgi:hypothetical protein
MRYGYLLLFGWLIPSFSLASEKPLELFTSSTPFFTSVIGSGTAALSISSSNPAEGSTCAQVSYTNLTPSSFAEVYRSYGTNTLDLSFNPEELSIQVKGQSGQAEIFRFMLYEDIDMDGNPFEAGDEIWVFDASSILSQTAWTTLNMAYTGFVRLSGSGNAVLDLNRIGAWRVVVLNSSAANKSGQFWLDDLRQHTTYTIPVEVAHTYAGSFIQVWNTTGCACGQWTQAQWETQMQSMKDACINVLVLQYGVYDDNAWYGSSSQSFITYTNPTLQRMLDAAEATGLEVVIGLYFDETWNSADKASTSTYSTLLAKHEAVIDELYAQFSAEPAWAGWYIPQEINDLEWQEPAKRTLLANWLRDVAAYCKGKTTSKEVWIAPFFGPNRPADDLEMWWESVLSTAVDIDAVYPQDGVGTTTKIVDVDVPHYFNAIKNACEAQNRRFGATVEAFQQTAGWPINSNPFAAVPASIGDLENQLAVASSFTSSLLAFEWGYLQPGLSTSTQALYDAYTESFSSQCAVTNTSAAFSFDETNWRQNLEDGHWTLQGIYTADGRSLAKESLNSLSTGMYILHVRQEDGVLSCIRFFQP